ncbi:MAG TPA: hypothetical protein PLY70_05055 [Saprospiraceae bacterium]|nr:hypothetical protein [Saprospiraceae bacterium]HPN68761.1 hypothetical protein [Saprospiraceae bacterium]
MQKKQFILRLTTLKIVKQSDRGRGGSEPYLWVTYFKLKNHKSIVEIKDLDEPLNVISKPAVSHFRALFQNNVKNGAVISIPPQVGLWDAEIDLVLQPLSYPMLGCIVVVLEEDETSYEVMKAGFTEYSKIMKKELNALVKNKLETFDTSGVSDDDVIRLKNAISSAVKDVIKDKLTNWQLFVNFLGINREDDLVGFSHFIFSKDEIKTTPNFDFPEIKNHKKITVPNNFPQLQQQILVEHYEITGSLLVKNVPFSNIDPCAGLKSEIKEFKTTISAQKRKIGTINAKVKAAMARNDLLLASELRAQIAVEEEKLVKMESELATLNLNLVKCIEIGQDRI